MPEDSNRISRRDVLRTAGAAALIGAVTPAVAQEARSRAGIRRIGPGKTPVAFELNGAKVQVEVEPRTTLLDAIRDHVGLTGTKRICDRGACGGCTVSLNGRTVNSCMLLAVDARGARVQTVEGLAEGDVLHPIQQAFIEQDATQCGFCTSGMLMSCAVLLERTKKPTDGEIREAVAGNLCRCGTYPHVFRACREVAR